MVAINSPHNNTQMLDSNWLPHKFYSSFPPGAVHVACYEYIRIAQYSVVAMRTGKPRNWICASQRSKSFESGYEILQHATLFKYKSPPPHRSHAPMYYYSIYCSSMIVSVPF